MGACYKSLGCSITSEVIGVILVIGMSVFIGLHEADSIINSQLDSKLTLSQDSFLYPQWVNPTPPIYMQFWMFNVTNPDEVVMGKKATVKQIGPFKYRLHQPKTNIAFFPNNTVTYKYNHTLVFLRNESAYDTDLKITQLNIPMLTVQKLLKKYGVPKFLADLVVDVLHDSDVFVTHTVEEFLFGYRDPIFDEIHKILDKLGINFPAKFGLFSTYNNSADGVYLTNTGKGDIAKAFQIQKWNGNNVVSWWSTPEANMINGTDGNIMPPKVNNSAKLYAFVTDVCRSLYFTYSHDTTVRDIKTVRFLMPARVFANATENTDNAGFCVPKGNCLDSGVLDISACKQDAPVVLSSPHFYLCAKQYVDGVNGMHPNKKEHETYMDLEPLSGSVFSGAKRLQINVHLQNLGLISTLKNIKDVIFPVLWLNESVFLDEKTANMFKSDVIVLINLVHILPYVILGLGILLVILGLVFFALWYKSKKLSYKTLVDNAVDTNGDVDQPRDNDISS